MGRRFTYLFLPLLFLLIFHLNSSPVDGGAAHAHHGHHGHHHGHHRGHHRGHHPGHHHRRHRHSHGDLISKACNWTWPDNKANYESCVAVLRAAVPEGRATSVQALGVAATKLAIANATSTRVYVQKLLSQTGGNEKYLRNCLKDCLELYTDAIPTMRESIKAFEQGHYMDANVWLGSVMDSAGTCDEGFEDGDGIEDPLTKQNQDLSNLVNIGLAISNNLLGGGLPP